MLEVDLSFALGLVLPDVVLRMHVGDLHAVG